MRVHMTGAIAYRMYKKLEELDEALDGDPEQGVAWMNDERSTKFAKDHPFLCKAWEGVHDLLTEYEDLTLTETNPESCSTQETTTQKDT